MHFDCWYELQVLCSIHFISHLVIVGGVLSMPGQFLGGNTCFHISSSLHIFSCVWSWTLRLCFIFAILTNHQLQFLLLTHQIVVALLCIVLFLCCDIHESCPVCQSCFGAKSWTLLTFYSWNCLRIHLDVFMVCLAVSNMKYFMI